MNFDRCDISGVLGWRTYGNSLIWPYFHTIGLDAVREIGAGGSSSIPEAIDQVVSCEKGRFDIFFNHLFNEVFLFPFSFVIIPLSHVLISILSKMLFNVSFNMHFTSTLFNAFFNMVFFRLWLCNREIRRVE